MIKRMYLAIFLGFAAVAYPHIASAQVASWVRTAPQDTRQPLMISLARVSPDISKEAKEKNAFILRLSSQYAMTGCARTGKIPYTINFIASRMKIDAGEPVLRVQNNLNQSCKKTSFYPSADIILSPAMLKEKGIETIEFGIANNITSYDIKVTENSVALAPSKDGPNTGSRYRPMPMDSIVDPMKLWFYPAGTVVLKAGVTDDTPNLSEQVAAVAASRGLVPLESVMPEFNSPLADPDSFYYVDKSGRLSNQLGMEESVSVGTIDIPVTVYGAEENITTTHAVQVFAHSPGAYE